MKALVVGYGSIGSLHARVLTDLGHSVTVVSKRNLAQPQVRPSIAEALKEAHDYAVIASATGQHQSDLDELHRAGFEGTALVEKPLFSRTQDSTNLKSGAYPFRILVGYNLRFHPVVRKLRQELVGKKILAAHAYVGQHLSTWRQGRDHRQVYSASRSEGGGVLRDLSHELDLLQYLFGPTETIKAIGGRFSDVTIDSDDVYGLLLRNRQCPVISLQLNYLDHVGRREMIIVTAEATYKIDLVSGTFSDGAASQSFELHRELTYTEMHRTILEKDGQDVCTYKEGCALVHLIESAERDSQTVPDWQKV